MEHLFTGLHCCIILVFFGLFYYFLKKKKEKNWEKTHRWNSTYFKVKCQKVIRIWRRRNNSRHKIRVRNDWNIFEIPALLYCEEENMCRNQKSRVAKFRITDKFSDARFSPSHNKRAEISNISAVILYPVFYNIWLHHKIKIAILKIDIHMA